MHGTEMTNSLALDKVLVLVVEDDYYQARDATRALKAAGGDVHGPFTHWAKAQSAVAAKAPTCAVLDVNVVDGTTFALARLLHAQAIPFVFITAAGCDRVPPEFDDAICLAKPLNYPLLVRSLASLVDG